MTVHVRRLVAAAWALVPAMAVALGFVVEGAKRWL